MSEQGGARPPKEEWKQQAELDKLARQEAEESAWEFENPEAVIDEAKRRDEETLAQGATDFDPKINEIYRERLVSHKFWQEFDRRLAISGTGKPFKDTVQTYIAKAQETGIFSQVAVEAFARLHQQHYA